MAHAFNHSTWEVEAGEFLWVLGKTDQQSRCQHSQDYCTEKSFLKKKENRNWKELVLVAQSPEETVMSSAVLKFIRSHILLFIHKFKRWLYLSERKFFSYRYLHSQDFLWYSMQLPREEELCLWASSSPGPTGNSILPRNQMHTAPLTCDSFLPPSHSLWSLWFKESIQEWVLYLPFKKEKEAIPTLW